MKFWIVTPSYNQLEWLKLCVASVADQATAGDGQSALGVGAKCPELTAKCSISVHHHVQDALSSDGTQEFLAEQLANSQQLEARAPNAQCPEPNASLSGYTFSYASEPDNGMYDAINRGWKLAPDDVDVIAHLNCDEQYLPKALQTIAAFMQKHPKADVVLADMIVVDKEGEYICHRRSLRPYALLSRFWCAGFTATTFQRAAVTKDKNVYFDTNWKNIGDKVWYNALHKADCRFAVSNQIVSVFTDTGENMNWTEDGKKEGLVYMDIFLPFFRRNMNLLKILSGINALRRLFKNHFLYAPEEYSIISAELEGRIVKKISRPSGRWTKKAWRD